MFKAIKKDETFEINFGRHLQSHEDDRKFLERQKYALNMPC